MKVIEDKENQAPIMNNNNNKRRKLNEDVPAKPKKTSSAKKNPQKKKEELEKPDFNSLLEVTGETSKKRTLRTLLNYVDNTQRDDIFSSPHQVSKFKMPVPKEIFEELNLDNIGSSSPDASDSKELPKFVTPLKTTVSFSSKKGKDEDEEESSPHILPKFATSDTSSPTSDKGFQFLQQMKKIDTYLNKVDKISFNHTKKTTKKLLKSKNLVLKPTTKEEEANLVDKLVDCAEQNDKIERKRKREENFTTYDSEYSSEDEEEAESDEDEN